MSNSWIPSPTRDRKNGFQTSKRIKNMKWRWIKTRRLYFPLEMEKFSENYLICSSKPIIGRWQANSAQSVEGMVVQFVQCLKMNHITTTGLGILTTQNRWHNSLHSGYTSSITRTLKRFGSSQNANYAIRDLWTHSNRASRQESGECKTWNVHR